MKLIVVSNNPMVWERFKESDALARVEGNCRDVLLAVRDACHRGHRLLSHPLSGSVKPNETPYKSVLISRSAGTTERESVELIEKAIRTVEKFGPLRREWRERERKDFQLVDLSLIESAMESAENDPDIL